MLSVWGQGPAETLNQPMEGGRESTREAQVPDPTMLSVENKHTMIFKLLLRKGANIKHQNNKGKFLTE